MNLLGLDVLTHVKQLSRISDELMIALEKAVPGDKLQIQFNTERGDRKSTRLNSSHSAKSRMPSSA